MVTHDHQETSLTEVGIDTCTTLVQRLLLETYAPAAILINSRRECLYALGPVDRYLRVASGAAAQDVLVLARDGVRTKLRAALRKASGDPVPPAKPAVHDGTGAGFDIEVRAVDGPGEATHMVCFVEQPARHPAEPDRARTEHRAADLERELAAVRQQLTETLRSNEHAAHALEAAKQEAERANAAKSRFLAAASHELRQPLQTLALLQGLLATAVRGEAAEQLVIRLDETLSAMAGMLNTVLGAIRVVPVAMIQPSQAATTTVEPGRSTVFIIDDDPTIRAGLRDVLRAEGQHVEDYPSAEAFLGAYRSGLDACLLIDATLPGLGGLDLLRKLRSAEDRVGVIIITGHGDVQMAVEAMRAGASDFIEKPVKRADLLVSLERALDQSSDSGKLAAWRTKAAHAVGSLTNRQREVMSLVLAGHPSKNIATDLGISRRTVENHRAAIMDKTGSNSLPALARLALAAAWTGSDSSLLAVGPPKAADPPFEK